jgi:broad specificity phosphatase PhoE
MTLLLLARHGETEWNAEGRFQGHADPPLGEHGRAQARGLAAALEAEPLKAVYASDLHRSRETAQLVAAPHGLEVVSLRALREIDVGEWSGLTGAEIEERWPGSSQTWREEGRGWRGGESCDAMATRVITCLERVVDAHADEQILYVGHGGTLRAVLAHARGISYVEYRRSHPSIANCSVHRVAVRNGIFRALD